MEMPRSGSPRGVAPPAGAWIENPCPRSDVWRAPVAPPAGAGVLTEIRERGLKQYRPSRLRLLAAVAPRAGAWIETPLKHYSFSLLFVAPRAGAWIEIGKAEAII